MILSEISKIISMGSNFAIAAHTSPDGDAIGSVLGLYNALIENGKKADVFLEKNLSQKFSFLNGFKEIKTIDEIENKYDCVIILDCGDQERLGDVKEILLSSDIIINIDHHISNNSFGTLNYIDVNASSVGEIIYHLLKEIGYNISKNISECLYVSIITDTGGFKYSNTTPITFSVAADLITSGIDFPSINDKVFYEKSLSQIRLTSLVATNIQMFCKEKVAVIYTTREMLNSVNATEDDTSELVNIARDIEGVELGIYIKEKTDDICKVSLRSKTNIDVRKIAEKFGGGGHIRAAGCTVKGNIDLVKNEVLQLVKKCLE